MTTWATLTKAATEVLAPLREAVRPAPRRPPADPWYTDDERKRAITQEWADHASWLKGRGRGWLTRPRERRWW